MSCTEPRAPSWSIADDIDVLRIANAASKTGPAPGTPRVGDDLQPDGRTGGGEPRRPGRAAPEVRRMNMVVGRRARRRGAQRRRLNFSPGPDRATDSRPAVGPGGTRLRRRERKGPRGLSGKADLWRGSRRCQPWVHRVVGGVPPHTESLGDPGDGGVLDHDRRQGPPQPATRQLRERFGGTAGVHTRHVSTPTAAVAADLDDQRRGPPPERLVRQPSSNRVPCDDLATAATTPPLISVSRFDKSGTPTPRATARVVDRSPRDRAHQDGRTRTGQGGQSPHQGSPRR